MKVTYEENFSLSLVNENEREFQPRLDYDEVALEALAKDIAKNGQHNPVGLHKKDSYYQVIYGFQRIIALKRLGWDTARANIYEDATWEELHEQSISNNERHLDLGDLEKALYIKALQGKGFSIPRLCELFGVNKSAIYNYLTVADLDDTTRECLHRRLITLNHAVELAKYDNFSKRLEILRDVISLQASVHQLRKLKAEGGWGPFTLYLDGWVDICPRVMRMVGLPECRECSYFEGEVKRQKEEPSIWHTSDTESIHCAWDWEQIPVPLRPLFKRAHWEELRQPVAAEVKEVENPA
ncbi:Nucleoid occlusion protein [subsurface metagenome]